MKVAELVQKLFDAKVAGFDVVIASEKRGGDIIVWVNEDTNLVTLEATEEPQ